jgi:hypothetical protein
VPKTPTKRCKSDYPCKKIRPPPRGENWSYPIEINKERQPALNLSKLPLDCPDRIRKPRREEFSEIPQVGEINGALKGPRTGIKKKIN